LEVTLFSADFAGKSKGACGGKQEQRKTGPSQTSLGPTPGKEETLTTKAAASARTNK